MAMLADGGWVVTWQSNNQDEAGNYGVYQQRYDVSGTAVGGERLVNTTITGVQDSPAVTALADGGWVVTWCALDTSGVGVYQQRYNVSGTAIGSIEDLVTTANGNQDNQVITALPDGGWLVVWQSSWDIANNEFGIFQQRYDVNGGIVGSGTRVHTTTAGNQTTPSVAVLEDGGWVVTWQSPDADGNGIFQQRFDQYGAPDDTETRVNFTTTGEQTLAGVAGLEDGGWVVIWQSPDDSGNGVYQQRYDRDGALVGTETKVNSYSANAQENAAITALSDGGWVVTWQSLGQDGNSGGIYQQRYDTSGTAVGGEIPVNTRWNDNQDFPTITALPDGGWVVAWQGSGEEGDYHGVFQKTFRVVNDAPVGTSATLTTRENTAYSFKTADFGFSDTNGDDLSAILITALPAKGSLLLNGIAVTAGQSIPVADIIAGKLSWTPPANQDGTAFTTIGFKVVDDGGTDHGGVDTDGTTRLITFDVTSGPTTPSDPDTGKTVVGGSNDDQLSGTNWDDILSGKGGNDRLDGGAGNDHLWGGAGNDVLNGGTGNDILGGGTGADFLSGGAGDDILYGGKDNGADKLYGGSGNDVIWAGGGNDVLYGGDNNDVLGGGAGNDIMGGGTGNDILYGGGGNDKLYGGTGNDRLHGGPGNDELSGGAGSDTFYFRKGTGTDRILDFTRGEDKIDLTAFSTRSIPLDFKDIGIETNANNITLTINGIEIVLEGLKSISRDDFIL